MTIDEIVEAARTGFESRGLEADAMSALWAFIEGELREGCEGYTSDLTERAVSLMAEVVKDVEAVKQAIERELT